MNPAFFAPQLRTFIPLFLNDALKVRHLIGLDVNLLKTSTGLCSSPRSGKTKLFPWTPRGNPSSM
jgi:hypothetical protein